jgi:hypothetical protein
MLREGWVSGPVTYVICVLYFPFFVVCGSTLFGGGGIAFLVACWVSGPRLH